MLEEQEEINGPEEKKPRIESSVDELLFCCRGNDMLKLVTIVYMKAPQIIK